MVGKSKSMAATLLRTGSAALALAAAISSQAQEPAQSITAEPATFKIQMAERFRADATNIAVELVAQPQADAVKTTYMITGLTADNSLHQWGLECENQSFKFVSDVSHNGVFQIPGSVEASGRIHPGDHVVLYLSVASGAVEMSARIVNDTNFVLLLRTTPINGTKFVGTDYKTPNGESQGTGVMTEIITTNGNARIAPQPYHVNLPNSLGQVEFDITQKGPGDSATTKTYDFSGAHTAFFDTQNLEIMASSPNTFITGSGTNPAPRQ